MDFSLIVKATGIVFRESLEAVLIYGIVMSFIKRMPVVSGEQVRAANLGLILGAVGSLFLGGLVAGFLPALEESTFTIVEMVIVFGSSALMLYMVFWMSAHARTLKKELEGELSSAMVKKSVLSITGVVFFAVIREGAETVVYLYSLMLETGSVAKYSAIALSFIVGVGLSYIIYLLMTKGSKKISMAKVFMITGFWLLVSSSSLLATGFDKIFQAGYLESASNPIYSLNIESETLGSIVGFIESLVGFRAQSPWPNLVAFLAFWIFVVATDPLRLYKKS